MTETNTSEIVDLDASDFPSVAQQLAEQLQEAGRGSRPDTTRSGTSGRPSNGCSAWAARPT